MPPRTDSRHTTRRPNATPQNDAPPTDQYPHSPEAETVCLSSMLLEPERADEVADLIRPEDFYRPAHRMIYAAICDLRSKGLEVDAVLVGEALEAKGQIEDVGGYEYLEKVFHAVPHGLYAASYAQIVREKALLRQAMFASSDCIRECSIPGAEVEPIIGETEQRLHSILERQSGEVETRLSVLLCNAMAAISEGKSFGLATGFDRLDKLLNGWQPGSVYVLAARPSAGKTALVIRCLMNVAKDGAPVLFFSLEQSALEVSERILSMESGIACTRLKSASLLSEEDRERVMMNSQVMADWPVEIDDTPGRSLQAIASAARRLQRQRGLKLIAVDYLQLIEPADKKVQREQQVAEISRGLKRLARELKVPVICLAQMNRAVVNRDDKRPRLGDLRESGAIEQDADAVLFLHSPWVFDDQDPRTSATLIVAKQRNGQCGDVPLSFDAPTMRFRPGTFDGEYPDAGGFM